ncbi:MAG: bile acid:sodium symporter [Pseudomonadota bacterium]
MDALQNSLLAHIVLPLVVMLIMAGMGLGLRISDFREILARPKAAAIGIFVQIFVVPAAAFAIAFALDLSPEMAIGLVILASCASGTNSNIFTLLAHANVALSITLTVICGLIAVITVPLLGNYAVAVFASEKVVQPVHLPLVSTIGELFAVSVLPVLLGMWFRHAKPAIASRLRKYVGVLGIGVLLVLLIVILYEIRDQIMPLLVQGGPAAAALILVGIAVGLISGKLAGLAHSDALAIAIEAGNKNATMGLMVTLTLLHSSTMSIPSAVYASLQFSFGLALVLYGRSRLLNAS